MRRPRWRRRVHAPNGPRTVAFVHDTNEFGGLEIVLLRLLAGLDRASYTPILVVPDADDADSSSPDRLVMRAEQLGVAIARYPRPPGGIRGRASELVGLARLFTRRKVDIVHIHTARVEGAQKPTIAARLGRVPIVLRTEHSPPAAFSDLEANSMVRQLTDRLIDLVVTVSEYDRRAQIDTVGRAPDLVKCLHNGIDAERFDVGVVDTGDPYALQGEGPVVGGLGRLSPEKGFEFLVRAVARLRDAGRPVRLVLVGTGPLDDELKALAADLEIADQVTFAGHTADPRPLVAEMDVAAMPSLHEGFPLTLLEFMAMERPTVVTDHPGMLEAVVPDETSVVVPRGDVDALAAGIGELLDDPGRRARMGVAAREHVIAHFTLDRYVTNTEALYAELLDDRS